MHAAMENESSFYNCNLDTFRSEFFKTFIRTPSEPFTYVLLATLHLLLIVLPSLFFNTLAIVLLNKTNKDKHPSVDVFYWICTVCILGPCSYGLLMDLSLLFDQPILGKCLIQWQGAIYWCGHSFFNTLLYWLLGILSIVLCLTISGFKIQRWKLNIFLCCVLIFFVLETFAFIIGIEMQSSKFCPVRGSFCLTFYTESRVIAFVGFARVLIGFPMPATIVVATVIFSFFKVKTSTVTADKPLIRSLVRLIIIMITGAFLITTPTAFLYFGSYNDFHQGFIELVSTYFLQINYVLYPTLILILHKKSRKTIKQKFRNLFKMRGTHCRILPSSTISDTQRSVLEESSPSLNLFQHPLSEYDSQSQDISSENTEKDMRKDFEKIIPKIPIPSENISEERYLKVAVKKPVEKQDLQRLPTLKRVVSMSRQAATGPTHLPPIKRPFSMQEGVDHNIMSNLGAL